MAKRPTNRQTTAKAPVPPAVTEPAAPAPAPAPAPSEPAPAEPAAPVPTPAPADLAVDATASPAAIAGVETIRMLVGQEGPELSRMRGQVLTIGTDLDADEAERLVRVDFAERI